MNFRIYLLFIFSIVSCTNHTNNVCPTNRDYSTKSFNKNCWYNSDVDLTLPEIIQKYNYSFEHHKVITDDGYILSLFRVQSKKYETELKQILQPVFLIHGIFVDASCWITFGNKSMGFIFADEGYDVWIINTRGTTYSKDHILYSSKDIEYWNFSFHEIGIYDIPKSLDLIYNVTGRNDTIVIGQSMGTNEQLVYATELPNHAKQRVKFMFYLGPTVFLYDVRALLVLISPFWKEIEAIANIFKIGEILSKTQFPTWLNTAICLESEIQTLFCEIIIMQEMGFHFENFPPEILPVMMSKYPAGSSIKTTVHLMQNFISKRFCQYDYGNEQNNRLFNSTTPPDYNISQVTIPGFIMYGLNDYLSSKKDSLLLYNALPKGNTLYEMKDKKFTHMDFFYSKNVVTEVIQVILDVMSKYKVTI